MYYDAVGVSWCAMGVFSSTDRWCDYEPLLVKKLKKVGDKINLGAGLWAILM